MGEIHYQDAFVNIRGLRLHYLDYGGEGETVVALHGLIQNAHAFDCIAPLLTPHVHLIALDLRGRGESDWGPAAMYRMPEYVADLTAFLARLKIDRLAFIGTSLGGVLARLYTTAHPERVSKLVLNDAAIGGNIAGTCRVAKRPSTAPKQFADWHEAISWFRAERDGLSRLDDATIRTWIGHYLAPGAPSGMRFRCDPAVIERASSAADELASERGVRSVEARRKVDWELAQRLVMPVLLLRGSLSDVILRETADHFLSAVPTARCVDIPGSGHSPTLHEPEAQAALLEFFGVASEPCDDVLSHSAVAQ